MLEIEQIELDKLAKLSAMNQLISEWEHLDDISKSQIMLLAKTGKGGLQTFFRQLYVILDTMKL